MSNDISTLDYTFRPGQWLLGGQMMFVAFGALVLVPLLTGLDPNVALFTAGARTLVTTNGTLCWGCTTAVVYVSPSP